MNKNKFKDYKPPSWDEYFMKTVYLVASKSKDPRTKIGAVLVRDNRIIATGYNGFPIGVLDSEERYNDRPTKYKFVVHAEANSILSCAYAGISSKDASLYTQGFPCCDCMKSIIQGGVKSVIIHKQWPDMDSQAWSESCKISEEMSIENGINISVFDKELGINGYLDENIIQV